MTAPDRWTRVAEEIGEKLGAMPFAEAQQTIDAILATVSVWPVCREVARRFKDDQTTCYHEAGHAVAALLMGLPISRIEIGTSVLMETEGFLLLASKVRPDDRLTIESHIIMQLAGPLGEQIALGGASDATWNRHRADAQRLAMLIEPHMADRERLAFLSYCEQRSKALLERCWPAVVALALALLDRLTLTADEVHEILLPFDVPTPEEVVYA